MTEYSVEFKPKTNPHPTIPQAWDQYVLTPSKWRARLYYFELWLRTRSHNHTRIREV